MRAAVTAVMLCCTVAFTSGAVAADPERGAEHYAMCGACHGKQGEGDHELKAPRISHLGGWYLTRQTRHFKAGVRGGDPEDELGAQVRTMVQTLKDDQAIRDVVAYIGTLDSPRPEPTVDGDRERGEALYETCSACHGTNGQGNEALNAPHLAGQSDWYLVRQLNIFREGLRGTHPEDTYGPQMRPMALTLPDEEAIRDVVSYINSLEPRGPRPDIEEMADRGEQLYAPCAACHGANGQGNQDMNSPRLTGQFDWYQERQLKLYKAGARGTHPEDTYGQQMRPIAMTLADEQAIRDVVAYIGTLESSGPEPTVQGVVESGKQLYLTCAACHGSEGQGNEAMNAPRLAGQSDWYLARQLKLFQEGGRGTHPEDAFGRQMRPMAMILADDQAIRDVVAYINTLAD